MSASQLFTPYANDPRWLHLAAEEQGQHEVAGAKDNARILAYFDAVTLKATHDEVPWCSAFVNWVLREAGFRGTRSALAVSWLQFGMPAFDAQRGAIVVLCRRDAAPDATTGSATGNHVGFLLDADATHVTVLGGNQGDQVKVSRFPRATYRVRAVRVPRLCDRLDAAPPAFARAA
jgi:uncharacterized protein (TIGR02594 family)